VHLDTDEEQGQEAAYEKMASAEQRLKAATRLL
jgi:hypothetical protein